MTMTSARSLAEMFLQRVAATPARDAFMFTNGTGWNRYTWAEAGDQKRVLTPRQARDKGADVLVIGRPITGAADPAEAARRIAAELL